jgi:hypothetical protein
MNAKLHKIVAGGKIDGRIVQGVYKRELKASDKRLGYRDTSSAHAMQDEFLTFVKAHMPEDTTP